MNRPSPRSHPAQPGIWLKSSRFFARAAQILRGLLARRDSWIAARLSLLLLLANPAWANLPGGGTGTGPAVTLANTGSGTVTLANGIVSIVITTNDASVHQIYYTYNNSGTTVTNQLLNGGYGGGYLYWLENPGSFIAGPFTETVVANNGNYAEVELLYASATNGIMDIHYSMLRGSPGFYTTAILTHRTQDGVINITLRPNIYAGSQFNWMSVDTNRNRLMEVSGGASIPVQGAPKECYLWTNGIYAGQYEDKYKYSADLDGLPAWGWSSVGVGGQNVGLWNITASPEYYPAGPMERSLMEHIGTTVLNVFTGGYYGLGTDDTFQDGETWTKTYGPYLYYCNNVTNTLTGTNAPAQALYQDALAQGVAEQSAWPYAWFTNANYAPAADRGVISGQMVINDSGNPNASAAGLWVGAVQQPSTSAGVYDFQAWAKPYQFWVRTDTNGNFTLPNVIAGTNYTLYAFGPGAPDTFLSQTQTGGSPPLIVDYPATQFAVTVTGGATNNLGTVTWTPTRVGPTVFEMGYPDRTAAKFRHGDDYWVGDIGPGPSQPSPLWSKWLEYPFDFPNGPNYVVGQSRWTTDWNFIQPVVTDPQGNDNNSSSTITFNLAAAPASGAQASFYLGLSSDYYSAVVVTVNGSNLGDVAGVTGNPNNSLPNTGYYAGYGDSDTSIREGNNGAFSDERLTFPASLLHQGLNTLTLGIRQIGGSYFADHFMYDYLRLELTGYVPPPPAGVTAYAGSNCVLVCWPATPGATTYNLLRATASGGGYVPLTNGVTGPVCGSGSNNAVFLDTSAVNGTTYYYAVASVNPTGVSPSSPPSPGATPAAGLAAAAPAAPTGLTVGGSGHQSVTLNWNTSAGAAYYSVWRSTLVNTGGGSSNTLSTIILNNSTTNTTFTDTSPSDGTIYSYCVTATGPGGTSAASAAAVAVPRPAPPAALPASLTAAFYAATNIVLNWVAVPGAVGYLIERATSPAGPFMLLQSVTETVYYDLGLNAGATYYYRVVAVNDAGVSAPAADLVNGQQPAPASLTAVATNQQVTLTWSAATNATGYTIKRSTSSGNETYDVVQGYPGTSYTNSGLANGTTYYYVVTATGAGGTSGNSPEASATPQLAGSGIWINAGDGAWSTATNWSGGSIASGAGSLADFSTLSLPASLTVTLDSPRTLSGLVFGDATAAYDWTLTGTNPLTLGAGAGINVENEAATISTPLAGTNGLGKTGWGALILGGAANALSGGLTVNAGSVTLDFTLTNSPADNLVAATNSLTLGGGGLAVNGSSTAPGSQTFSATTLNSGASVIAAGSGGNTLTLALGPITTSLNAGDMVEFKGPATTGVNGAGVAATATLTTSTAGGSGLTANYALYGTVGLYDYAATAGASPPYTVVGASQVSGFYTAYAGGTGGPTGGNVDLTGTAIAWGGIPYLQSLRFNTGLGANQSVNTSGNYSTLQAADLLVTPNVGAYNVTFNIANLRPNTTGNGPELVWQNNPAGELILNSAINRPNHSTTLYDDAYAQAGAGTVVLNNPGNGYTGQSYLNGGVTLIAGNGCLGMATSGAAVNLNGGTLVAGATFTLDNGGTAPRPVNLLGNGGGLAATAGHVLTVDGLVGGAAGTGPLTIGLAGNPGGRLPGTGPGTANATPVDATGTVVLTNANVYNGGTILQNGILNINGLDALGGANYGGLTFNGGTLQYAANLTGNNGPADLTSLGTEGVTLAAGGGTIDLNGNAVTYAGALGNGGRGALTVESSAASGSLTLLGANNYQGNTTVTNATLVAANPGGSATGSGNVTVQNNGSLAGNGGLAGSVTVAAGGTLAPGTLTGSLNIGGSLTLAPGSTVVMQVQHLPLANSSVTVADNLAEGGTLLVTNLAGPLAAGDSFNLFNAASYTGSFALAGLPALPPGLLWNTNTLTSAGTLSVVALTAPLITDTQLAGNNLVIRGAGGVSNWPFYLLAATNLPTTSWTIVGTNAFDANGNFNVTNPVSPAAPQQFFLLRLQ